MAARTLATMVMTVAALVGAPRGVAAAGQGVLVTLYTDTAGTVFAGHRVVPTFDLARSTTGQSNVFGLTDNWRAVLEADWKPPNDINAVFWFTADDSATLNITDSVSGASLLVMTRACCAIGTGISPNVQFNGSRLYRIRVVWTQLTGDAMLKLQYAYSGTPSSLSTISSILPAQLSISDTWNSHALPGAERTALSTLYNTTIPWASGSAGIGWDTFYTSPGIAGHPCVWLGVECSVWNTSATPATLWVKALNATPYAAVPTSHVTRLTLPSRGLRGNFTVVGAPLAALPRLAALVLSGSSLLTGSLPPAWAGVIPLVSLDITGTGIALEAVPLLPALTTLTANGLVGRAATAWDTSWCPALPALATLSLISSAYTALPPNLATCAALTTLDVSTSQLTALGPEPCGAPLLATLRASGTPIASVAPCMLTSLPALTVWEQRNGVVPWAMPTGVTGNLTALRTLDISSSKCTDLDGVVARSAALSSLVITGNALTSLSLASFPASGAPHPALTTLDLSANPWAPTGAFPDTLFTSACLPAITTLTMTDVATITAIPPIANLTRLATVRIQRTSLPAMPIITNCTALATLDVSYNPGISVVPAWVAALPALTTLTAQNNSVTAVQDVPPGGVAFPALTTLTLAGNLLTGLPPSLARARFLATLSLRYNNISLAGAPNSSLPEPVLLSAALLRLYLSGNPVTVLPDVVGASRIQTLECVACNLTGTVPPALCNASRLASLVLSSNALTALPRCLATVTTLTRLEVTANALTALPPEWAALPPSITTDCINYSDGTQWTLTPPATWWPVPDPDIECTNTSVAVLHSPPLFPALTDFLASDNRLTLDALTAVTQGPVLATVRLARNNLHGMLPAALTTMPALVTLDLSANRLTSTPLRPPVLNASSPSGRVVLDAKLNVPATGVAANTTGAPMLPSWFPFLPPTLRLLDLSGNALAGVVDPEALHGLTGYGYWPFTFELGGNAADCAAPPTFYGCDTAVCHVSTCAASYPASVWPLVVSTLLGSTLTIKGVGMTRNMQCEFIGIGTPPLPSNSWYTVSVLYVDAGTVQCVTPEGTGLLGIVQLRLRESSTLSRGYPVRSPPLPYIEFAAGCPPGYTAASPAQVAAGAAACQPCAAGTRTELFNEPVCQPCDAGYEAVAPASTTCTACLPGYYTPTPGTARCVPCVPGTYAAGNATAVCTPAAAGEIVPASGASAPIPCPPGRIAPVAGLSSCSPCVAAGFTSEHGASQCIPCAANSRPRVDESTSAADCLCLAGFWGPAGGPCLPCPTGAACPGMTSDPPRPLPGYWSDDDDPATLYRCSPPEACLGTTPAANATCATGYTGRICAVCQPLKYYRLSGGCSPCPNLAGLMWFAMAAVALGGCALILRISQPRDMKLYSPSIALTFIQLLSLFTGFSTPWPHLVSITYKAASSANLNVELFSPECSVALDYWSKFFFKVALPFVFGTILLAYYMALPCYLAFTRTATAAYNSCARRPAAVRAAACIVRLLAGVRAAVGTAVAWVGDAVLLVAVWIAVVLLSPLALVALAMRAAGVWCAYQLWPATYARCCRRRHLRYMNSVHRAAVHTRFRRQAVATARQLGLPVSCTRRAYASHSASRLEVCTLFCCGCTCIPLDSSGGLGAAREVMLDDDGAGTPGGVTRTGSRRRVTLAPRTGSTGKIPPTAPPTGLPKAAGGGGGDGGGDSAFAAPAKLVAGESPKPRPSIFGGGGGGGGARRPPPPVGAAGSPSRRRAPRFSTAAAASNAMLAAQQRAAMTVAARRVVAQARAARRIASRGAASIASASRDSLDTPPLEAVALGGSESPVRDVPPLAASPSPSPDGSPASSGSGGGGGGFIIGGGAEDDDGSSTDSAQDVLDLASARNYAALPMLGMRSGELVDADGVFRGRSVTEAMDALRRTAKGWGTVGDTEKWSENPLRRGGRAGAGAGAHRPASRRYSLRAIGGAAAAGSSSPTPRGGGAAGSTPARPAPERPRAATSPTGPLRRATLAASGLAVLGDDSGTGSIRTPRGSGGFGGGGGGDGGGATARSSLPSFPPSRRSLLPLMQPRHRFGVAQLVGPAPPPAAPERPAGGTSPGASPSGGTSRGAPRHPPRRFRFRRIARMRPTSVPFGGVDLRDTTGSLKGRHLRGTAFALPGEHSLVFTAPPGKRVKTQALQMRRRAAGIVGTPMVVDDVAAPPVRGFGLLPWHVMGRRRSSNAAAAAAAATATATAGGGGKSFVNPAQLPAKAARGGAGSGGGGDSRWSQVLMITDPATRRQVSLASWKLLLLPRTSEEIDLIRRFDIEVNIADRFVYATISLLTIGYTFLAAAALEPLNCIRLPNGAYALKASTEVACYTEEYQRYLPAVVLASLVYVVGIPLFLLWILLRARTRGQLGTPAFDYRYGSITLPYTRQCWWFELVSTARKLAVIMVVQFLGRSGSVESTLTQLMVCMSVFSAYAMVQVFVTPYTFVVNNRLSLMTTVSLLFCIFSGLLYANDHLGEVSRDYTAVVTVAIVAACGVVILYTVGVEFRRAKTRADTSAALGLNRYQVAAMEQRVVSLMFPHASVHLAAFLSQMTDADKDEFLQDCFRLLALMPTNSMNPAEALQNARDAALASSTSTAAAAVARTTTAAAKAAAAAAVVFPTPPTPRAALVGGVGGWACARTGRPRTAPPGGGRRLGEGRFGGTGPRGKSLPLAHNSAIASLAASGGRPLSSPSSREPPTPAAAAASIAAAAAAAMPAASPPRALLSPKAAAAASSSPRARRPNHMRIVAPDAAGGGGGGDAGL